MPQYGTAAQARKRAHNMSTNFYSDAEINDIMTRYSLNLHLKLGKAVSGDDFTASNIEFETAKTYVINATACEMLASVEIEDSGDCKGTAEKAIQLLTAGGGGASAVVTAAWELEDKLDEDLYLQRDPP